MIGGYDILYIGKYLQNYSKGKIVYTVYSQAKVSWNYEIFPPKFANIAGKRFRSTFHFFTIWDHAHTHIAV